MDEPPSIVHANCHLNWSVHNINRRTPPLTTYHFIAFTSDRRLATLNPRLCHNAGGSRPGTADGPPQYFTPPILSTTSILHPNTVYSTHHIIISDAHTICTQHIIIYTPPKPFFSNMTWWIVQVGMWHDADELQADASPLSYRSKDELTDAVEQFKYNAPEPNEWKHYPHPLGSRHDFYLIRRTKQGRDAVERALIAYQTYDDRLLYHISEYHLEPPQEYPPTFDQYNPFVNSTPLTDYSPRHTIRIEFGHPIKKELREQCCERVYSRLFPLYSMDMFMRPSNDDDPFVVLFTTHDAREFNEARDLILLIKKHNVQPFSKVEYLNPLQ